MNQDQKKYAMKRVEQIERAKRDQIKKSDYTTPAITFDAAKRLKLFKAGKYKLSPAMKEETNNPFERCYVYFNKAFLFDGEREESFDDKKFDAARDKISNQANKIRDQIMLGDSEKALAMIQEFEKA